MTSSSALQRNDMVNLACHATQANRATSLPTTRQLLLEGGDARIALSEDSDANKYGCQPLPNDALLAFGSSTASTISTKAFNAADRLRQKLAMAMSIEAPEVTYQCELERIRLELKRLCELDQRSDIRSELMLNPASLTASQQLSGTDLIFAASGTDLHLIATQLVAQTAAQFATTLHQRATLVIMMEAEETGSGVPMAVAGRHFSTRSALGESVVVGDPVAEHADQPIHTNSHHAADISVVIVPIRLADGTPRAEKEIDDEVESLANKAKKCGMHVLLTLVDVTKTGMIAPSIGCALRLSQQLPNAVTVLVDACQFRISNASLRGYLRNNFMVALTGSKFLTGPTFSGVLMIPPVLAQQLRRAPMPPALFAYSCRADWPEDWPAAMALRNVTNFGLLLRWEAALEELRAFRQIPEAAIADFLTLFSTAVHAYLNDHPVLQSLPVPALDRGILNAEKSWDQQTTIFPFLLCASEGNSTQMTSTAEIARQPAWLSRKQTMQVYRALLPDLSKQSNTVLRSIYDGNDVSHIAVASLQCQLGQPVLCGERNGLPVSALRLCASARLIVEATANQGQQASQIIANALAALDKTIWLLQRLRLSA